MNPFSILNKPAVKANNKQAGLVFLEYSNSNFDQF